MQKPEYKANRKSVLPWVRSIMNKGIPNSHVGMKLNIAPTVAKNHSCWLDRPKIMADKIGTHKGAIKKARTVLTTFAAS
jgi:hypothetical protein